MTPPKHPIPKPAAISEADPLAHWWKEREAAKAERMQTHVRRQDALWDAMKQYAVPLTPAPAFFPGAPAITAKGTVDEILASLDKRTHGAVRSIFNHGYDNVRELSHTLEAVIQAEPGLARQHLDRAATHQMMARIAGEKIIEKTRDFFQDGPVSAANKIGRLADELMEQDLRKLGLSSGTDASPDLPPPTGKKHGSPRGTVNRTP